MKIEFNNIGKERVAVKLGEFEITSNIVLRITENEKKVVVKLRNTNFETTGRILKLNNIAEITQIVFGEELYDNLKYTQHELYIHKPIDDEIATYIAEDLNITFERVV